MRFFQWGIKMIKSVMQSAYEISRKVWRRGTSQSSLRRHNHELRYQVEVLKVYNTNLSDKLEEVKDENILLWQHMDEMKESERAIMQSITDEIQDNMIRTISPIGDA